MVELIGGWGGSVWGKGVSAVKGGGEDAENIGEGVVAHVEHFAEGYYVMVPG